MGQVSAPNGLLSGHELSSELGSRDQLGDGCGTLQRMSYGVTYGRLGRVVQAVQVSMASMALTMGLGDARSLMSELMLLLPRGQQRRNDVVAGGPTRGWDS